MSSTHVPRHVRARRADRQARLRELGYDSYPVYLHSPHWLRVRAWFWDSPDTPKVCMCGETEGLQLHHKTYHRIGRERLTDLLPLCTRCHAMIHTLEFRGEIGLELSGFESAERALAYAAAEAERTERDRASDVEIPVWYRVLMLERNPHARNENRWRSLVGRLTAVEKALAKNLTR